jgi:GNAT superfamily N-acetyltransferase
MTPSHTIHAMDASQQTAFLQLHCGEVHGQCSCVAWWVPTWDEFGRRTPAENLAHRRQLWEQGIWDGYLLYEDQTPAAWCQAGPRDRLAKLREQHGLPPDPKAWAVTCFLTAPDSRGRGHAAALLVHVIGAARAAGATRLEAFPLAAATSEPLEEWTGPRAMFESHGFTLERDCGRRLVMVLAL